MKGLAIAEFELVPQPDESLREEVYRLLRDYNAAANPEFWRKSADPQLAARPLNLFARDGQATVVGGLFGETQFLWLKVAIMAVASESRSLGIGAELLRRAETEAIRRGCCYAYLDTMAYQAPGFYQRQGYQQVGHLKDWDSHGHDKYFFTKQLAEPDG